MPPGMGDSNFKVFTSPYLAYLRVVVCALMTILMGKKLSTLSAASNTARRRLPKGLRAACAMGLLAGCLMPAIASAAPLLRCQLDQGGSVMVRDFSPVADPYGVVPVVVIGDAQHVEYIKLYVYSKNRRQPVLLHEASYVAPTVSQDTRPSALTGINYVYTPQLERELKYGCALLESTP